jgi:succinate dehydrogenase/fumarate reductase iron-sulfur protein
MKAKLSILRSDPESGKESWYQTFEIDVDPAETVAGALLYIYENIDPSLAFRFICNLQKCGECAVMVNGSPCLACERGIEPEMTIEPLPNLPIIKDLVIDRLQVFSKPIELLPFLKTTANVDPCAAIEQDKVDRFVSLTKCVECLICQSVCPARRDEPERFAGPLGLVWLAQSGITGADHWEKKARKALELCVFCGDCWAACPHRANIPAVFFKEQVIAPCRYACPAGIDVPRYIRFIRVGKFAEALAVIREKIPFPAVCGHVCIHPCEAKCRRALLDDAIGIRALKRFAAEQDSGLWKNNSKVTPATGKRVAIVGSGPAGLTTAYYLAKLGHSVTVFETLPEPGGMMRVAIPDYRLPKDILRAEIAEIESVGVNIKINTRVDSLDALFQQGYNAIFLAVGAHQGLRIGVSGEDSPGVMDCVLFLREVSLGKKVEVGNRVAVIGGGNAAIDSARTALRLGAKEVAIVYRRTRGEMPASAEEIDEAIAEGVKIHFLAAPSRIISRNGVLELESLCMGLGAVDASGRSRPEPIEGSEFVMSFDTIIAAIGQRPEVPGRFDLSLGRGSTIEVDPNTLATSREGVFAGGDVVRGPASIIEAIADGRQAAISIDKYLGGSGDIRETLAPLEHEILALAKDELIPLREREKKPRVTMCTISIDGRLNSFAEVELGFSDEQAIEEAKRCLRCDLELEELNR